MKNSKHKKVLITGGAGFLGSHLCEILLKSNATVFCLDNYFSGNKKNIESFFDYKNFSFINHDISDPYCAEIDQIYNLACPASPIYYQINPVKTIKTCINGSINMLELAKYNKASIFQASTSEIYGDPEITPQNEKYLGKVNPIGPRACYDEGKRAAETLFFDYKREYNIDIKVGRIFNTYGPKMHPNDGRVVSNFICQALTNKEITIYGNGTQTRSFCFVDDLIEVIIKLMDSPKLSGPMNLGNPHEIKISKLAELIISLTNSKSLISFKKLPVDDPKQRCPDINLANTLLDWSPNTKLETGLTKTIKYFEVLLKKGELKFE